MESSQREGDQLPWVVQKYGGTSVGKFLDSIVKDVLPSYLATNRVVIVCSARSGRTKALGTTSLLLQAAAQAMETSTSREPSLSTPFSSVQPAGSSTRSQYDRTVDLILDEHLEAARGALPNSPELLAELEADIKQDCEQLRAFLGAAQIIHEVSPRSRDVIMGLGERLACRLVSAALKGNGIEAELVCLDSIVSEMDHEVARGGYPTEGPVYLEQSFYDQLSVAMGKRLQRCKGIPVVTGYFGDVPGSLLAQVGRGYTDLCAALCAVGVKAAELQIWKEVDGVFTADPRKVPTARLVPAITPEEAAELTYYGSEVIHPFTMEQAIKKSIPIRIKNVQNPRGCGTVVFPDHESGRDVADDIKRDPFLDGHVAQPQPPDSQRSGLMDGPVVCRSTKDTPRKIPTAVTIKDNILVLNVHSNRKTISHGFLARIFGTLDRYGIVVDLISTSEVHVSMAMTASIKARTLEHLRSELQQIGAVSVIREMVILSLVGKQMRHMVGVAGRMFSTLAEGNINIEMISQGANEINISCVIHERAAMKALNLIHYSILELSPKPVNMEGGSFGRSFF
ncbi:aspartate kinase [Malassezia cuniculi]|uniref:aspartate kinase n=1 Tax=Malassezia cuniculi TaxID=948313 RepID=A0AAF0ER91_9BASI|nr:aspartate kinase [Malassezia cuniculi]